MPAHTTWHDLTLHRQLLHSGAKPPRAPSDESFEYTSDDDMPFMLRQPRQMTPGSAPMTPPRAGLRRVVWERPLGGLPTYQRSAVSSPAPAPTIDSSLDPPVLSHLHLPTVLPKVNYKHLYLTRRILARRMTQTRPMALEASSSSRRGIWNPRVTILTSGSSTLAGGLPGHVESIYSLHLFQHHMKVTLAVTDTDELCHSMRAPWPDSPPDILGTPVSSSWPGLGVHVGRNNESIEISPTVVSGRDWLLSGSRDKTLRLWQIGVPSPRVVKVFSGGHTGSILCHFVAEIPVTPPSTPRGWSPLRSPGSPTSGPAKRLVAISGASDGRICLWDIEHGDGTPEKVIEAHTDSVLFVRGDDEHIVSCSKDRTIRLFDIRTLKQLLIIEQPLSDGGHRGAINAVALTKDFIVSASGDRSLRIWSIKDGKLLATVDAHGRGISCMSLEPSDSTTSGWVQEIPGSVLRGTVVTGSSDMSIKTFYIVQVPSNTPIDNLTFRDMLDLDLDSDMDDETRPRFIIQPGVDYVAECQCPMPSTRASSTAGCLRCLNRGHTDLVRSLHIGETVTLSASYDSTIKMWNRRDGKLIANFEGFHSGRVFAITGDRVRVVSSGLDARIALVDFSEGLDTAFI